MTIAGGLLDLTGRVALVTGGGSGIGAATAQLLAQHGAEVAVTDLNAEAAGELAKEIAEAGGKAVGYGLDVGSDDAWRDIVARVTADLGAITILHGNAAPTAGAVMSRDLDVLSAEVEVWDLLYSVVMRGNMLGSKHILPGMIAAGGGSIVFTTSIKGRIGSRLRTGYSATKAGLEQFVRMVATEYGPQGIRCNAVAPGIIVTPSTSQTVPGERLRRLLQAQLVPRYGKAEDIARAVLFLASDASSFVTAQTLVVDGGMSAFVPAMSEREEG
jgi:NAD(P)-dependent dehydrogenase (short-subunit alcohol dehydrogenase family)